MDSFVQELRHAVRTLRNSPGFTAVAVLTLGLGMGASTAIYTLLKRVVLDPLPYPESSRLVRLKSLVPGAGTDTEWQLSTGEFFYFGREARSLQTIGSYQMGAVNVQAAGDPQRAVVAFVTASMLPMLGARPVLGRLIDSSDDSPGAPLVAVLSNGFWRQHFGGDPGVVGQSLRVNETVAQIIGVLAPGVELPRERGMPVAIRSELWVPMRLDPAGPFYNNHVFPMIARLAPGATLERAQAEIDRLTARLPDVIPSAYSPGFMSRFGFRTALYPLKQYVLGGAARDLWILFAAVGLVLLIAYGNVANLLLVRVEGRRREMAIRAALGAGRGAIVRQYFAESLVLALAGGAVALLFGMWGVDWLISLAPAGIPRLDELRVDGSVLLYTLGVSLAVAAALAALAVVRRDSASYGALTEGGRSATAGVERRRARGVLVVAQMALALVLVVSAALLVQSFRRLRALDPGIDPRGVLTLQLHLPNQRYDSLTKVWRFYDQVLGRIRALPGVAAAGVSEALPFMGGYGCTVQGFEDADVMERLREAKLTTCAGMEPTSPGFFEALGIPVLAGRVFTRADNDQPATGAVVVSKAFAERFWPGQDAIGKGILPFGMRNQPPYYRVVGVVGDVLPAALGDTPAIAIYYPIVAIPGQPRWWPENMYVVVRTSLVGPLSLLPAIRQVVREADPAIPVANAEEMQAIVDRSMSRVSFAMVLLGVAAVVALLLAAVGLYGVISYVVARRTSEIGVRIALGAQPVQVERLVVGGSLKLTLVGVGVGIVAALGLTRVLQSMLFGVRPTDPVSYLAAAVLLASVAAAAAWLPARRAARVDPMVALRSE